MPSPYPSDDDIDVDVLVIGAGVSGIYQLHTLRQAGFSVRLLERGEGPGGTWYWNRYPGARFDSESYTYGYLFSPQLFHDWHWSEHFASQPEIERYLNHVVDRFDLRAYMRFGAEVTKAVWDESSANWTVTTAIGEQVRSRYLIAATGRLSVPFFPEVPGRESFRGASHHTGLWPKKPVDVAGKRVAVIGTGSSGSQIVPVIVPEVESLTVYQRTANWATPLNNAPISPQEQLDIDVGFEQLRDFLATVEGGFLHTPRDRNTFDDSPAERRAFYERVWRSRGFAKLFGNYRDLMSDPAANAAFSAFVEEKVREIVADPAIADQLIPRNHGYGHKRPPFVTGFYEAFNNPKVSLVDLAATPILRVTPAGIETVDGVRDADVIVWATGFDFGSGALLRLGIQGREGTSLTEHWREGPRTFLGLQSVGFPNLFFPGGPHGSPGNVPRAVSDMVDFVTGLLIHARHHGDTVITITQQAEERWTRSIDDGAAELPGRDVNYAFGSNIPGKPRRFLVNPYPRADYLRALAEVVAGGYHGSFVMYGATEPTAR